MKKTKVYLAGKMTGLTKEQMTGWRTKAKEALKQLGMKGIDPCDYYNFDMPKSSYTEKEIMRFDLWAVAHSDVILISLDWPDSIGSAIEVYKAWEAGIPVIGYREKEGGKEVHPWILECIDKLVTGAGSMEAAIQYISKYYSEKRD